MARSVWGSGAIRPHLARLAAALAFCAISAFAYAQTPKTLPQLPIAAGKAPPRIYGPEAPAGLTVPPEPLPSLFQARVTPIPPRPDEARKAKVYDVFDTHCVRCHQTGKTIAPLPSGGLGGILDLDRLTTDPAMIRAGLPDASRVYDVLVTRHAPLDVYQKGAEGSEPRPEDIQIVREWIRDLPPIDGACGGRQALSRDRVAALIREAQRLERDGAPDLRFISIAHLYNGCATTADLVGYRQALTKLLNSVSRASAPLKLTALDAERLVFAVRLTDLGWRAADWEMIARAAPPTPALSWPDDIKSKAATRLPIAPGDWLAAVASEPPLYYALLGVPAKLADLARDNGFDIDQDIQLVTVRRAAVKASAVTRGNRIAERHAGKHGGVWLAYDFATSNGDQNVFERPLGPDSAAPGANAFKPDMIRAAFTLPNGFLGFALFDAAGNRIDRVAPGIELPYAGVEAIKPEPGTKAGANCFACHVDGVVSFRDDFRAYAATEPSPLAADVRDGALALFPAPSEMALLVSGDVERYRSAKKFVGVDADASIGGDELVTALAKRYRRSVGFEAALMETGLLRDAFVLQLAEATGPAGPLARRLQQGVLPRADLNTLYALLKGGEAEQHSASGGFLRDVEAEIGLSVWLDPPRPRAGDLVTITAEADADCYLTVIGVDAKSKATVLYPNDFEAAPLISAGKTVRVPATESPYQLRFRALGPETIVARCSTSPKPPMGIEHDFERQKFTALGNWEVFIQDTLLTEAELRNSPEKALRAETARADARRRRAAVGIRDVQPADTNPGQTLRDGRAVVVISVN